MLAGGARRVLHLYVGAEPTNVTGQPRYDDRSGLALTGAVLPMDKGQLPRIARKGFQRLQGQDLVVHKIVAF